MSDAPWFGELVIGRRLLDRFELTAERGRGGFSVVYAARDHSVGNDVAIKVLVPPPAAAREAKERMRREVNAIRGLRHPSLVGVHDFLEDGPIAFVVMDLIDGEDLAARIRSRGPLAPDQVVALGRDIADAGDDRSAGPIMALVVEFWPTHYMALYHAGASEAALGSNAAAREHLARFLELYHENDGWRSNAIATLKRLGAAAPAEAKAEAEEK